MFRFSDVEALLKRAGGRLLGASASNWASLSDRQTLERLEADERRWERFLEHEVSACAQSGVLDGGTHILFGATPGSAGATTDAPDGSGRPPAGGAPPEAVAVSVPDELFDADYLYFYARTQPRLAARALHGYSLIMSLGKGKTEHAGPRDMSRKDGHWGYTEEAKEWATRARRRDEDSKLRGELEQAEHERGLDEPPLR